MNLHLLLPDLFWPQAAGAEPYRGVGVPALETLLGRGAARRSPGASLEQWFADEYGIEPQHDRPFGPLALLGDGGEPSQHFWLAADPVHLKVHHDQLVLAEASRLHLVREEADALTDRLNAHFGGEGIDFVAPRPQRWYLRAAEEPRIRTTPTAAVAGRRIDSFLPSGTDGKRWRGILNEVQMALHGHPCNEAREARGELPINSVWLWGAGRMPALTDTAPYGAVWSGHPLALGVAAAAGAMRHALPPSGDRWLSEMAEVRGDHEPPLVVLDGLRTAACYRDLAGWRDALQSIERDWLAPLLAGLRAGKLTQLTLHALGCDFSCVAAAARADLAKLWRRAKRLSSYA